MERISTNRYFTMLDGTCCSFCESRTRFVEAQRGSVGLPAWGAGVRPAARGETEVGSFSADSRDGGPLEICEGIYFPPQPLRPRRRGLFAMLLRGREEEKVGLRPSSGKALWPAPTTGEAPREWLPLDYIFTIGAPQQEKLQSELSSAQESQHWSCPS